MQDLLELSNACAASAVEFCDPLWSPGTIPQAYLLDIFGSQLMFTRTCGEDIPDCNESAVPVQPSVESSSNVLASHYEIMMASRDKGSHMHGLGSVCTFPTRESLQTVPASACKHSFGNELTELATRSTTSLPAGTTDYSQSAGGQLSNSYATIDLGEQEATLVMHPVISGRTSARTGGEIRFSNFGENTTTPSTQLRTVWKRWRANSSRNLLKPPTTEHATASS